MRRLRGAALLALVLVSAPACMDLLLGPEADPADPRENFDLLWEAFDRHYSFFILKDIDWDDVRDRYRPRVGSSITDAGLLDIVADMLDELEDGHVNVFTEQGVYGYVGWYSGEPRSYLPSLVINRMGAPLTQAPGGLLEYGEPEPGIGYVRIPTFVEGMAGDLDVALQDLDPEGLIIDLRHNGGGSDSEVSEMAGRLVTGRALYRTVRFRNGPEHDDFTPPMPSYVEPRGPRQFTGPVVLLTNRRTFSSAETFVLAARTRAGGVTVVGDTTGGGSGNPIYRELPNGWIYRLSRWISFDAEGRTFEGVGLAPDRHITFEREALADSILEEGIRALQDELGG